MSVAHLRLADFDYTLPEALICPLSATDTLRFAVIVC